LPKIYVLQETAKSVIDVLPCDYMRAEIAVSIYLERTCRKPWGIAALKVFTDLIFTQNRPAIISYISDKPKLRQTLRIEASDMEAGDLRLLALTRHRTIQ